VIFAVIVHARIGNKGKKLAWRGGHALVIGNKVGRITRCGIEVGVAVAAHGPEIAASEGSLASIVCGKRPATEVAGLEATIGQKIAWAAARVSGVHREHVIL
jgi:hypothetical protein